MQSTERVESLDQLAAHYRSINEQGDLFVGIEWERSGVYRDTFKPVTYYGDNGYQAVLHKLVKEVGWGVKEKIDDMITELKRRETRVTTEGDGRLELAGSPKENLHDLGREFRLHDAEVQEMGRVFNIGWLPLGMQPLHGNKDITMLPKKRYRIFEGVGDPEFMETQTKRTNGFTVNVSVTDEKNAIRKAQTAFRILPVVGAMLASSPLDRGKLAPYLDMRRYVIHNHAPQRTALPGTFLDDDFSYRAWVEFIAGLPVVLIKGEQGDDVRPDNLTFLRWMKEGYEGRYPTVEDFDQHVKTTWPDIRLRQSYLEYRVPDSVPLPYGMACAAFVKGLLMDSVSWEAVDQLFGKWSQEDVLNADREAWRGGLQTEVHGKKLLHYAQELLIISTEALHRFQRIDGSGADESAYLAPLKEQIHIREKSIAEEIAILWEKDWAGDPLRLLEYCDRLSGVAAASRITAQTAH